MTPKMQLRAGYGSPRFVAHLDDKPHATFQHNIDALASLETMQFRGGEALCLHAQVHKVAPREAQPKRPVGRAACRRPRCGFPLEWFAGEFAAPPRVIDRLEVRACHRRAVAVDDDAVQVQIAIDLADSPALFETCGLRIILHTPVGGASRRLGLQIFQRASILKAIAGGFAPE